MLSMGIERDQWYEMVNPMSEFVGIKTFFFQKKKVLILGHHVSFIGLTAGFIPFSPFASFSQANK